MTWKGWMVVIGSEFSVQSPLGVISDFCLRSVGPGWPQRSGEDCAGPQRRRQKSEALRFLRRRVDHYLLLLALLSKKFDSRGENLFRSLGPDPVAKMNQISRFGRHPELHLPLSVEKLGVGAQAPKIHTPVHRSDFVDV